jgi:SulP family sulfate permease
LASIITAVLIALVVLFLTPLFYYLPQATLAAVILVAVINLLDFKAFGHLWQIDKADAWAMLITFVAVLVLGIELGIVAGFVASILFFLWRTSHPHIAEVGRLGDSEHFRNIQRHDVQTAEHVLAVRIDENLYFANTRYLEEYLLKAIADHPHAQVLLLNWSAINHVDASALETLERLFEGFREAGVDVYLSDVKGPVMDQLKRSHFDQFIGEDHIFLSMHLAMQTLTENSGLASQEFV